MPRLGSYGFSKKDLRSQIGRADREELRQLRASTRELLKAANAAIKDSRKACLATKKRELDEEDQRFDDGVKALRQERKARKRVVRAPCYADVLRAEMNRPTDIADLPSYLQPAAPPFYAHRDAENEIQLRGVVRRSEKKAEQKQRPRRTAGERLSEQNDLALANIPDHLHALWGQLKGSFKANKHRAAWEAFMDWVDANPSEVRAFQAERQASTQAQIDRELQQEQAAHYADTESARRELEAEIEEAEPTPIKGGKGWNFTKLLDKPVTPISNLSGYWSPELADLAERAAIEGKLFMAWRVADLEVLKIESTIYLCYAGGAVEHVKQGKRTVKAAVEAWLKKQQKVLERQEKHEPQRQQKPRKGRTSKAEVEQDKRRPAPAPTGGGWKLSMVKGKKPESVRVFRHPVLEEHAYRAAQEERGWQGWRIGEIEILQESISPEGGAGAIVHISHAGGPVESFQISSDISTRAAVEAWVKEKERQAKPAQRTPPKRSKAPKQPRAPRKGTKAGRGASIPPPARVLRDLPPPLRVMALPAGQGDVPLGPAVRVLTPPAPPLMEPPRVLALPAHMPEEPSRPLAEARADEESESLRALDELNEDVEVAGTHLEELDGFLLLRFPEKPSAAIRERLKLAGFRWWNETTSNQHPAWRAFASDRSRQVAIDEARAFAESSPAANAYEQRRQERIARLQGKAARVRQHAEATYGRARELASVIPFGQPILVGHHSERRDRRYRAKIDATYHEAFSGMKRADELERRAHAAEKNTAISSDDPDALDKLRDKLKSLEDLRAVLPQARKVLKKYPDRLTAARALAALGLGPENIRRLMPDPPLDRWAVTTVQRNTTGEITRLKRRIEELEQRAAAAPPPSEECGDARISEEDNRVRIRFASGKPPKELRGRLRGRGFIWAPSAEAWQRKASRDAWYAARDVLRGHYGQAPKAAGRSAAEPCCSDCEDPPPVEQHAAPPEPEDAGSRSEQHPELHGEPQRNTAAAIALGWLECGTCGLRAPEPREHNALGNFRCPAQYWCKPRALSWERVTKDDLERARRIAFDRRIEELNQEGRREGVEVRIKAKVVGILFDTFPSEATRNELGRRGFSLIGFNGRRPVWTSRDASAPQTVFDIVQGYINRSPAERIEEAEERERQEAKERAELEQSARGQAEESRAYLLTEIQKVEEFRRLLPQAREILEHATTMAEVRERLRAAGIEQFHNDHVGRLTHGSRPSPKVVDTVRKAVDRELAGLRDRLRRLSAPEIDDPPRASTAASDVKARVVLGYDGIYWLLRFENDPSKDLQTVLEEHAFVRDGSAREWRMRSPFAEYWAREILIPRGYAIEPDTRSGRKSSEFALEPTSPAARGAAIQASRPATAQARTPSLYGAGGPVPPAPAAQQEPPPPTTTADWRLTSWERTGSLFGATGPVPPPPGERHVPPQRRLPFK